MRWHRVGQVKRSQLGLWLRLDVALYCIVLSWECTFLDRTPLESRQPPGYRYPVHRYPTARVLAACLPGCPANLFICPSACLLTYLPACATAHPYDCWPTSLPAHLSVRPPSYSPAIHLAGSLLANPPVLLSACLSYILPTWHLACLRTNHPQVSCMHISTLTNFEEGVLQCDLSCTLFFHFS